VLHRSTAGDTSPRGWRLASLDGRLRSLARGQGTEFDSLRSYVVGDDVRSIDWRATARSTEVMIRTWRPERDRRLMIVLDTGPHVGRSRRRHSRLDASMDAALLLSALASRAGDRVDLIRVRPSGPHECCRARLRPNWLAALVNGMATLEPSLVESDSPWHRRRSAAPQPAPVPGRPADRPGFPTHWNKACCRCCGR